jgi:hypothetical protein
LLACASVARARRLDRHQLSRLVPIRDPGVDEDGYFGGSERLGELRG